MFDKGIFKLRSHQNWEQSGSIAQNLVEEKKLISEAKSKPSFTEPKQFVVASS
jgi:hypothetical protein